MIIENNNLIVIVSYLFILFILLNYNYFHTKKRILESQTFLYGHLIIVPFYNIYNIYVGFSFYCLIFIVFSLILIISLIENYESLKNLKFEKKKSNIIIIAILLFVLLVVISLTKIFPLGETSHNFLIYIVGDLVWFSDLFNTILNDSSTKTIMAMMFLGSLTYIIGVADNNDNLKANSRFLIYGIPIMNLFNLYYNQQIRDMVLTTTLNSIMQDVIISLHIYILIQFLFFATIITIIEKFLGLASV